MEKAIRIGIIGLGVVGGEVARVLQGKAAVIAAQVGRSVELHSAAVRDLSKTRSNLPPGLELTTKIEQILEDPEIDIVVEVMGGEQPALDNIKTAIKRGKHVVTANKAVMATHGPEIIKWAEKHGRIVKFEASVGGGIPIIGPLQKDLVANNITAVHAIINGTTNYILTRMAQEGLSYNTALLSAQDLGYAEADPSDDLDGRDAAYKLTILAMLAFHSKIHVDDVFYEGINRVGPQDFRYAKELGYAIKLLAIGRRSENQMQLRVHPTFVPLKHPLGKVEGVFNAIELEGDLVGRAMFHGRGAGGAPTSSAVISDIVEVSRSIVTGGRPSTPSFDGVDGIQTMANVQTQYYLRLHAIDRPGVMAQITRVLGELGVSLASVIQKGALDQPGLAEIVITTHLAKEMAVQAAVGQLEKLEVVTEICNLVRVEELGA